MKSHGTYDPGYMRVVHAITEEPKQSIILSRIAQSNVTYSFIFLEIYGLNAKFCDRFHW